MPAYRPITIRDLLTHTSGICYRFRNHPLLGRKYVEANINDGLAASDHSLAENVRRLAGLPLANQPGTAWEYGLSTDVLGRLVEVVSGQSLEQFFTERIFNPLKMNDTHFVLPEAKRSRLAALYEPSGDGNKVVRTGDGPTVKGALIYAASLALSGDERLLLWRRGPRFDGRRLRTILADVVKRRRARRSTRSSSAKPCSAMTHDQIGPLPMWIPVHGFRFGYGFGINTLGGRRPQERPRRHV